MSTFQPIRLPTTLASPAREQPTNQIKDLQKPITIESPESPSLDSRFYQQMPSPLRQGSKPFSGREKDSFLLAALAVLGSCMNTVHGVYDGVRVKPLLFVFIIAPAGSGKGSLVWARRLGNGYHKLRSARSQQARQDYEQQLPAARQNTHTGSEPPPPLQGPVHSR